MKYVRWDSQRSKAVNYFRKKNSTIDISQGLTLVIFVPVHISLNSHRILFFHSNTTRNGIASFAVIYDLYLPVLQLCGSLVNSSGLIYFFVSVAHILFSFHDNNIMCLVQHACTSRLTHSQNNSQTFSSILATLKFYQLTKKIVNLLPRGVRPFH